MTVSCIYTGTVRHRRFRPRPNRFRYRLFMMYLDLAELPRLFDSHPLWSGERPNLAWFRRRDHFGDPSEPLERSVRALVAAQLGARPRGPIRMLTHLRYFGLCFNPATFFYVYDADDTRVETIVVEIHNTPWGQRYCYVLADAWNRHPSRRWRRYRLDKRFHVSPFIPMEIAYDWRFKEPGATLNVHMIDIARGRRLFDATLALERRPLTRRNLNRALAAYPLMTAKVSALIYFQALRLWLKGTPFFTHPDKRGAASPKESS